MSDFLTSLAARTLSAPSLRPRARLRFEPAGDEMEPGIARDPAPLAGESPAPVAAVAPLRPFFALEPDAIPTRSRLAPPPPDAVPATAGARPSPVPGIETRAATEPAPPTPVPNETTRAHPQREPAPAARVDRIEATSAAPVSAHLALEAPGRPATPRFDEEPPRRVVETEVVRREGVRIEAEARARVPGPAAAGAPEAPVRARRPAAGPAPPPPGVPARRPIIPAALAPVTHAAGESVVHVSIGRIEVRATPPAPPRGMPRRNAAMTIDEYVEKRKGRP